MKKYIILFILLFGAGIAISDIDTFEGTATDSLSDIEGSTVAAGGGESGQSFSDDYEGYADSSDLDDAANWTSRSGIDACGVLDVSGDKVATASGSSYSKCGAVYSGQENDTIKHFAVIQIKDFQSAGSIHGAFLRCLSDGSGYCYAVRFEGVAGEYVLFAMDASGDWGGESDTTSGASSPDDGDYVGFAIDDGTGTGATVSIWDLGASDPGGTPSSWGAADHTLQTTGFDPTCDSGKYVGIYIYEYSNSVETQTYFRGGDW
jgi:hypothetical protein